MEPTVEQRHLPNAPIREALFDIRAQLPEKTTIDFLERMHQEVEADYPAKQTKRWVKSELQLRPDDPAITAGHGVTGFLFKNADGTQVVQFRLDGFSFSRLAPYQTWEDFLAEAQRLWRIYRDRVHPEAIPRVAVRYINQLTIPAGERSWREYLRSPPALLPEGIEHPVSEFLTRYSAKDVSKDLTWLVTLAMRPEDDPSRRLILLDIDTFKLDNFDEEDHIWTTAELLRKAKNTAFFGTLSEHALELCT